MTPENKDKKTFKIIVLLASPTPITMLG